MFIKKVIITLILVVLPLILPTIIHAQNIFEDDFETGEISDKWPYISGNWTKESFNNSTWSRVSSGGFTDNQLEIDNNLWTDYIFKVDIFKIEGEDINLFFRTQGSRYLNLPGHNLPIGYGLHMQHNRIALQKFTSTSGTELHVVTENVPFLNTTLKHVEIKLTNNNIKIFFDNSNSPIIDYTDADNPFLNGGVSIGSITGSSSQNVRFDNIVISELSTETAAPSPTPTESATPSASPSASPTTSPTATTSAMPTATPIVLNVPNLKQYSLPWKNKLYAFTQKTIHEFGCALTSAAMILQYHGHNINPDKLNDWLKNEPDGYIRNGLINWLAITRYTKLHDTANSPSLEFKRLLPTNENLTNELTNNRPAILKENGHFVVAKSILGNTFGINDPGYSNRNDLTPYNNSFLAINSFTPSHTDLSYMMFVVNPNINLKLFDNNNNPVDSQEFIEDPINNLIKPNQKSGSPVKILILSKPQNGKYTLKLTGNKGKYNLDSYLYDVNGKVTTNKFEGKLNSNDTDKFTINFEGRKSIKDKDKKSDFKFWFKDIFDFFKYFYKN